MNKVILLGNLTKDIELKTIPSGDVVGKVGIATNESYKNKNGEKVDKVSFHNLTMWGKQAETLAKYTQKGSKLLVEGKISYRQWEAQDGTKRTATDIIVERFEFAGSKQNKSDNQNTQEENHTPKEKPVDGNGEEIKIEDIPF